MTGSLFVVCYNPPNNVSVPRVRPGRFVAFLMADSWCFVYEKEEHKRRCVAGFIYSPHSTQSADVMPTIISEQPLSDLLHLRRSVSPLRGIRCF